jgi:hypothetical protein
MARDYLKPMSLSSVFIVSLFFQSIAHACGMNELQASAEYTLLYTLPEYQTAIVENSEHQVLQLRPNEALTPHLQLDEVLYQQVVLRCAKQRQRKVILYQNKKQPTIITEQALTPQS